MHTLLMLGDSLVEWGDWQRFLPKYTVINRGLAGETTEELSVRLINEIQAFPDVDAILLQTGTNNLLLGSSFFPAIVAGMVPRLRHFSPQRPIIINSLMPMPIVPAADLAEVNRDLEMVAADNVNCFFLDTVGPFNEQCLPNAHPGFLNDQVHLSTRGYQVWAGAIRSLLDDLFPADHTR